jgi:hypothetical protein
VELFTARAHGKIALLFQIQLQAVEAVLFRHPEALLDAQPRSESPPVDCFLDHELLLR